MNPTSQERKNWTGNNKSIYTRLGASGHSIGERQQHDYYATHPDAIKHLLEFETPKNVWEPHAGELHLVEPLREAGIKCRATDIIERSKKLDEIMDFAYAEKWEGDILMNPPYKEAQFHVWKALDIIPPGRKVFAFLKLQFLEGKARKLFFEQFPPKHVYVFSFRIPCFKNGRFDLYDSSAVAYAWFVWEKGYHGDPKIRWI